MILEYKAHRQIEAQCEVLNMQSEQLKELSVLLLAGVALA
jgi:hypothetical protein